MATTICVNSGSSNGLLSDGTKTLPEPILTPDYFGTLAFNWEQFHDECPSFFFDTMGLNVILLLLVRHLPGAFNWLRYSMSLRFNCNLNHIKHIYFAVPVKYYTILTAQKKLVTCFAQIRNDVFYRNHYPGVIDGWWTSNTWNERFKE